MVTKTTFVVVFCVVLLAMAVSSTAGPMVTVWQETATTLHAEWIWNPEGAGLSGMNRPNWSGNLRIAQYGWDLSTYRYEANWDFQHKVAPHPGDAAPAPQFQGSQGFAYLPQNANGTIIGQSGSWSHPAGHEDNWTFTFYRDLDPSKSRAVLDVNHVVPEPSSLLALGAGAVGLLGVWRKRR